MSTDNYAKYNEYNYAKLNEMAIKTIWAIPKNLKYKKKRLFEIVSYNLFFL